MIGSEIKEGQSIIRTGINAREKMSSRICIVGSGAIGGLIGTRMSVSGQDVTLIDRDEQLKAILKKGLRLLMKDGEEFVAKEAAATGSFEEAGKQDVVILCVKAHQIPDVAGHLPALFGPDTSVVTVQNGIPWWYFQRHGGEYEGRRLQSLDPTGIIEANVDPNRIIGCVAYPAATVVEPGVIQHVEGDRFPIGELDGSKSERCQNLMKAFTVGIPVAYHRGYPCRDLAQGMGDSVVQSHQRTHTRHYGGDLPFSGNQGAGGTDDA